MKLVYRFAALLLACSSSSPTALAHPRGPGARYSVSVHDERGSELPTFHHAGQTFILGTYGERYTIRVENRTARRVEAVVTVDGRDVISGQVGNYVSQRGYLIDPYDQVTIEGFRQNWEEVAAFRFTSPQGSYSARMGTPENVGVIGVAIFPERAREVVARARPRPAPRATAPSPYPHGLGTTGRAEGRESKKEAGSASDMAYEEDRSRRAEASESAAAAPRASVDNLGTEYGESLVSSVEEVQFRRANAAQPETVIAMRYDDREGLIGRGIALEPPRPRPRPRPSCGPEAFPHSRFAPPPPPHCDGW